MNRRPSGSLQREVGAGTSEIDTPFSGGRSRAEMRQQLPRFTAMPLLCFPSSP